MGNEGRVGRGGGRVVSVSSFDLVMFRITCHHIYENIVAWGGWVGRVAWGWVTSFDFDLFRITCYCIYEKRAGGEGWGGVGKHEGSKTQMLGSFRNRIETRGSQGPRSLS